MCSCGAQAGEDETVRAQLQTELDSLSRSLEAAQASAAVRRDEASGGDVPRAGLRDAGAYKCWPA